MERIRKIYHKGKEIIVLDYSKSKTDEMIKLFDTAKQMALAGNKPVLVLSIFEKNYLTPSFMRYLEKEVNDIEHLLESNAVIGLSDVQKWILKGMNLWYKRQLHHFDSYHEALEFLVSAEP